MRKSLYLKFIAAYILLGIAGFITLCTLGVHLIEDHLYEHHSSNLYKEATNVASTQAAGYYDNQISLEDLYATLVSLSEYQDTAFWLIDPQGEIIINTEDPFDPEHPEPIDGFNPASFSSSYYSRGDFYGKHKEEMLSVIAPITSNMSTKGYIAVHMPTSFILEQRESLLAKLLILSSVLFSLSLGIMGLFTFSVYLPLKKIKEGANRFAAGDLKYNIPISTEDEMGYLAASLNYMSDELDKVGDYQRQFVSNVSHDFRSPLTSIKGYAEAMQDGTIPYEMQDKYLGIIVFESERLHKLTESLLTLNDMNGKGKMLNISAFDINGIIKSTAATFEGTCREKKISIDLLLTGKKLYVSADMVRIQQVLYNLLDNAIKFSPRASVITLETTEKQNKVFISVKDTGEGIPKESLSKIWDRFYKSDTSRGKDRKGTGLGLAIVKDIITAHNQNINVISTEGIGTEFIFTLEKAKVQGR